MKLQKLNNKVFDNEATKLAKCTCVCVCVTSKKVALATTGYGNGAMVMAAKGLWDYVTNGFKS